MTDAQYKEAKSLIKKNNKKLTALVDREVSQGAWDPAQVASISGFLAANKAKWYFLYLY